MEQENSVRAASITWISLTLQHDRPEERRPDETAEELLRIAEEFYVPVEEVRKWIHRQEAKPAISITEFAHWAKAFDMVRQMERKRESEEA